jgi:hypothetical protein
MASRKVLKAAKCSQMSNPTDGSGSGGDRCTEACAAMIYDTYALNTIAPFALKRHKTEDVMYWFTQMLNKGSNVSALEDAAWIAKWMKANSAGKVSVGAKGNPTFQDIVSCIDRNHIAVGAFSNYAQLRLNSGANPYKWLDHSIVGHVLIIVGYDTSKQTVIVHDPLRADPGGQPADYSWSSFQKATFYSIHEVVGSPLSTTTFGGLPTLQDALGPNDDVVSFLRKLDELEQVANPFYAVNANVDHFGPVSFTDPISWAGSVMSNIWSDVGHIMFRLMIILIGFLLALWVLKSLVPQGSGVDSGQAAQLAMLAV